MTTRRYDRRQALGALGTVSLGALFAACGGNETATTSTGVTTTDGTTATVEPQTTTSGDLPSMFDDAGSCAVTPELTEGPYYFDADAVRSDIREDRPGERLRLGIRVRDAASCEPVSNAVVEIWHCDAGGVYSGFEDGAGERFLRGAQVTNGDGIAEFVTVYPGWYRGRTVHIHAKVHISKQEVLTSQVFFDEDFTAKVYESEPYSSHPGRDVFNDGDGIFAEELLLTLREDRDGQLGLITFDVESA
jgi:protocatechuate 3,4-dioxygenase beta subunit